MPLFLSVWDEVRAEVGLLHLVKAANSVRGL